MNLVLMFLRKKLMVNRLGRSWVGIETEKSLWVVRQFEARVDI